MTPYNILVNIIVGGFASSIATQLLSSNLIPVAFEKNKKLTAGIVSLISTVIALTQDGLSLSSLPHDIPNLVATFAGTLLIAVGTYEGLLKNGQLTNAQLKATEKLKNRYGWRPDLPDARDFMFKPKAAQNVPKTVDLRGKFMPAVYNQGNLGSCTANAIAGALDFMRAKQGEKFITPSRLFIYYNERDAEGAVKTDSGATIRESVKAVVSYGACPETEWPYKISQFTKKPPLTAYSDATKYEALQYQRVQQKVADMQAVLAGGDPFVAGISVYESFESDTVTQTGIIPMPAKDEELLGGHAILIVGYQTRGSELYFIGRNSWGADWGQKGYFFIPATYLTNSKLASDFWTLQKVS